MSLIRLYVGVAVACLSGPCCSQQVKPWSSNEIVKLAIENNRELMALKQRSDEARGLLRQAGVRPAPALEANGVTGRPLGTKGEEQFGAGIVQTLETGGKRSKRIQLAEKQATLAEAEYDEAVRRLRFGIRSRYAEYASEAERLAIVEDLRRTYERSMELTKARVKEGDAASLEEALLSVELSRVDAQKVQLLGRLEAARADLARLVGVTEANAVPQARTEAVPSLELDLEQIRNTSLKQRADLRAAELGLQAAEADTLLAKAQGRADVTISAAYSRVYSRFDDQYGYAPSGSLTQLHDRDDVLSVGVSLPLFSRNRNAGNIEAAAARARAAGLRAQHLRRMIPLEAEAAWKRVAGARQAYEALSKAVVGQAQRNLEVIRGAHQLGQLRLLDVLYEQRRFLDTQLSAIDAKLDLMRGLAELELVSGGELW